MNGTPAKKAGKIGLLEKLGFGAFSLSMDAFNNFLSTFLLFFLTDVLGITPGLAGTASMIGTVWDGVNDPLIGFFSTNHRFKSREVARPYALWFAVPTAIFFVLIFRTTGLPQHWVFPYFLLIYLIFDTFRTFNMIPSGSMTTLATSDVNERISLGLYISGGSGIGVILATLGCWPLINALSGVDGNGKLIDPQHGFFIGALFVGAIWICGSLFHYFTTRERVLPEEGKDQHVGLAECLKLLFGCREWVENTLYYLFYNFCIIFVTSSIVYYATYVLKDAGAVTPILAAYIIATLVALPFVGVIHKKIGRKKTMILSAAILILSKVYFIIDPASLIAALSNGFLVGVGVAFGINAFATNRAEIADLIYYRKGKRIENLISSVSTTVSKIGLAVCTFAIGTILEITGYDSSLAEQPAAAIGAIKAYMGIVPLVMAVIMLLIACFSIIEKSTSAMKKDLEAQK